MCILCIGHFFSLSCRHTFHCRCKRTLDSKFKLPACVSPDTVQCWPSQSSFRETITNERNIFKMQHFNNSKSTCNQDGGIYLVHWKIKHSFLSLCLSWNQLRLRLVWIRRQLSSRYFESVPSTHNTLHINYASQHTCSLFAVRINTNIFSWLCLLF